MTRTARILATTAASVVAALASTAAATAGAGPSLSGGAGCAISCIESAVVTPTASSATLEVRTSVPTSVTVLVAKADATLGLTTGPSPKHVSLPSFVKLRTLLLPGLEPATAYRIVVTARDLSGRTQTRSGTFATREVKAAMPSPTNGLSAGLGCKADCIETGTLTSDATVPGRARLVIRTTEPATLQVRLVAKTSSGALLHQLVLATGSRKTAYAKTIDGLLTGTRYAVTATATDAQGRTWDETGAFRTRSARALVIFHKVTVIADADKGIGRGEIFFDFMAGGVDVTGTDFRKIGSGDTVTLKSAGSTRPGILAGLSVDGRARLELEAMGVECDAVLMKNCVVQAGVWSTQSIGGDPYVVAKASVDLRQAFVPGGALPPNFGTGLPAGHDAYVVWETTQHSLKYRVYATVDVEVA